MKIAVNTRLLLKDRLEGIGWFTHETMKRITREHEEHDFFFLFDRKFDDGFVYSDNIYPVVVPPQSRHPLLWYWWFEQAVPNVLEAVGADIFVSPDNYFSLRSNIPGLVVVHDINFFHFPQNLPFLTRNFYNHYTPLYAKAAKRIATVSEYSKKDIVASYNISPAKIDVVYNGASDLYCPVDEVSKKETKLALTGGEDYFLFVGALNPRKNIHRLFKAFDMFLEKTSAKVFLVVVGEKMFWPGEIKKAYNEMKNQDKVLFTGRQSPEKLKNYMASALGLVLVSTFEGFGIPVVEAMYAETPVLASNVTSLPEIAGDAAVYADPFSVPSIADGLLKLYKDGELRNTLVENGKEQRKKFTWDKTAKNLWESIEKCFPLGK